MSNDLESLVPLTLVLDADRPARPAPRAQPLRQRATRVAELRRRILAGYYASDAMMDAVARRMVETGEV